MEKVILEKQTTNKDTTLVSGYIDNKEINPVATVKQGIELLVSLEPYGYKFSNLKLISYREGSNSEEVTKMIIQDLVNIKNSFIDRASELMS